MLPRAGGSGFQFKFVHQNFKYKIFNEMEGSTEGYTAESAYV